MNCVNGFRQAIFVKAFGSISGVSGRPDNAGESDTVDAIEKIIADDVANEREARARGDAETLAQAERMVLEAQLATNTWLPSVDTVADLPADGLDPGKNYLCKVLNDANPDNNIVWQLVAGEACWKPFAPIAFLPAATATERGGVRVPGGNGLALEDDDALRLSLATPEAAGAMSAADKKKLDGIEEGATASTGGGKYGRQVFLADGTFIVPPDVTKLIISACGGGGGGGAGAGGTTANFGGAGGGGGGAAAVIATEYTVLPNSLLTISIGSAGAGGTTNGSAGNAGGNGGNTVISGLITLAGGRGGNPGGASGGAGGQGGAAGGQGGGHGGVGGRGTPTAGAAAGASGVGGTGGNAGNGGGGGGSLGAGAGGRGGATPSLPGTGGIGNLGSGGGGGGSGGNTSQAGTSGGAGVVIIEWETT